MKHITIILPCMNSGEHLKTAVNSIIENTKYPYRLILVESESKDRTDKYCDDCARIYPNITVIHTLKEGITKAINKGINKALEDVPDTDIYLTQDDVILPEFEGDCWLTRFVKKADKNGPMLITAKNGYGVSGPEYKYKFLWFGTWSLYIKNETIRKIGLFDESFSPGPGDDIDYSYRCDLNKVAREIIDFEVNHHRLTENFNDHIEDIKKRNADNFRNKYNIPMVQPEIELDAARRLWDVFYFNRVEEKHEPSIYEIIRNKNILDYGCGNGEDTVRLLLQKNFVTSADICPKNLSFVKNRVYGIGQSMFNKQFFLEKSDAIPIKDNTFDVIWCHGVLHHIKNPIPVINEFKRVLKENGQMYIMLYTEHLYRQLMFDFPEKEIRDTYGFGYKTDKICYAMPYTIEEGKELLKDFNIISIKEFNNNKFRMFRCSKK